MKKIVVIALSAIFVLAGCAQEKIPVIADSSTKIVAESTVDTKATDPTIVETEATIELTIAYTEPTKIEVNYPKPQIYDSWLPASCWTPLNPEHQGIVFEDVIPNHGNKYEHPFKIYLPDDYFRSEKKYNIVILLNASNGDGYEFTDNEHNVWYGDPFTFKDMYDQIQAQKLCEPFIVICPDYNKWWSAPVTYDGIANEIKNYLLPYIAEKYRTYIEGTSLEDIIAARDHIAMGGGSLGAEFTFGGLMKNCTDVCANFIPMSAFGNFLQTKKALIENNDKYPINLFYYVSGDKELHDQMNTFNEFTTELTDVFTIENTKHCLVKNAHHSYHTWAVGLWNFLQEAFERTPESLEDYSSVPKKEIQLKEPEPLNKFQLAAHGPSKVERYFQQDDRWYGSPFGRATVGTAGCGPTCAAMTASYLTNNPNITPKEIGRKFGHYMSQYGASWNLFPAVAEQYGFKCTQSFNADEVYQSLKNGNIAISCQLAQKSTLFTDGGHYILLSGITEEGKVLVNDPNYYNLIKIGDRFDTGFDMQDISSGSSCYWICEIK